MCAGCHVRCFALNLKFLIDIAHGVLGRRDLLIMMKTLGYWATFNSFCCNWQCLDDKMSDQLHFANPFVFVFFFHAKTGDAKVAVNRAIRQE
jgi:hypothetical protein